VSVPLDDHLRLAPEDVLERITDKTRLIIVNSPSNPTGSVATADQVRAIAEIAEDKGIWVLSDEVYEHFIYRGTHVSPGQFSDNVITVNAVSKTYAMTGWRLGYLAAKGGALEQLLKIHQYVQACASSISQAAALEAITGPQDCVARMRDEFKSRRDLLVKGFRENGVNIVEPDGAFYLFPKVGDGDLVAARLGKAGVIAVPGSAFGPGGKEHIRISYAAARSQLEEALRRMKDIL
jgi:aspartate aminotransferase